MAWYLVRRDRTGPFSFDELKRQVAAGEIRHDDVVWNEGASQGVPVKDVPLLLDNPPVLPQSKEATEASRFSKFALGARRFKNVMSVIVPWVFAVLFISSRFWARTYDTPEKKTPRKSAVQSPAPVIRTVAPKNRVPNDDKP